MQSPCWSEAQHQLEMPKTGQIPLNIAEPWRGWTNLIAHGALTPGLLSALMLAAGLTVALHSTPAQAANAQAAAQYAASPSSAPVISIQRPTHADQLRGVEQIQIHIKAGRYPADKLEMYVDDRLATEGAIPLDASMLPTAVFNWDTKVFADGPHRLAVVVIDKQGFKSRAEVQIYINNRGEQDIIPPVVRWLNVRHGDVVQGDFSAQVDATDNFGVKWVIISLNRAISPALKPPLRAVMVNTPPYILRLRTDLPADRYVLSASAWDAKDNRGDAPTIGIIVQPNIRPGFNIPPTPQGNLPLTQSEETGPSGENNAANIVKSVPGESIAAGPQPSLDLSLNAPRVTMPRQERFAGDAGLIPPVGADVTARAGLSNRSARMAKMDAISPRSEARVMPVAPPAVVPSDMTRSVLNGQIATGAFPLERAQRAATGSKPNLAKRPELESRLIPGVGQMTRATQGAALRAPSVPAFPAKSGATRAAKLNPLQPKAEARNAAPASPVASTSAPQLARVERDDSSIARGIENPSLAAGGQRTLASSSQIAGRVEAATLARQPQLAVAAQRRTSIARGDVSLRPRASTHANVLASLPGAKRRAAQSAPDLTPMSAMKTTIARPFPAMQSRPSLAPALVVLPKGAPQYPQMPSFDLSAPVGLGIGLGNRALPGAGANKGLSPSQPKKISPAKIALNPPMPKSGGAQQRPLAAITVAPRSEWGAVAENANMPGTHVVRRDDTLYSIARRYKMPVAVLAAANNMKEGSTLPLGAQLTLPRSLRVTYAGKPVPADAPSFTVGSVGVTPFRFLFERQGGKLTWDAKTGRVTARGPQGDVSITVGSRTAVVNQKEVLMDLAAFLMSGRTMVPLRFMEDAMQARVDWDPATGRIYVAMANTAAG